MGVEKGGFTTKRSCGKVGGTHEVKNEHAIANRPFEKELGRGN